METNYTQINTKEKSASSNASFFKSSILKCSKTMLASLFILFFAGNLLAQSGDFVTKWNLATTGTSSTNPATTLTFGTVTNGSVSYSWTEVGGSGSGSSTFSGTSLTITGLPTGATIELRISPTNFRRIKFANAGDKGRLLDVKQWGTTAWTSFQQAFFGCTNLNITATDKPNLANVKDMSDMFQGCSKLSTVPNIGSWDVSKVENMTSLFNGCTIFNENISGWNTVKVAAMTNMFNNASAFNQNLGDWNVNSIGSNGISLNGSGMNCENYSATLIGWNKSGTTGKKLQANGLKFSPSLAERANLALATSSGGKGWTISGDAGTGTCNDPRLTITTQTGLYDYQGVQVTEDAVDRTWQITTTSNISNGAITFQWTNSSPNLELTGFTRVTLGVYTRTSGYTGSGDWTLVNTGSATRVGTTSSYTTSVTGLTLNTGITYYFGVSNSITPLPVSIIDFKGIVKNDIISLNWTVTDEEDLSRYDIYSSTDGINFSLCGSVAATMSERGLKTYQFQDLSNKSALVYYRLKSINNDETGEWSSIVAVHTTKTVVNKPLKVYPNPATDFINLEFDGIDASNFNVLVMDMSGKVVYKLDGVETEINQYILPLNGIESGMYIVQLSDEFGNTKINRFSIK
jgi:surface protein